MDAINTKHIERLGLIPFDGKTSKKCKKCHNKDHLIFKRKANCGCLILCFYCCDKYRDKYQIYDIEVPCSLHSQKQTLTNFQKSVQAFRRY